MIREFFVPGQPQGKGRAKVTVRGKFAHAYTPDKTVSYENLIKVEYLRKYAGQPLLDGELTLWVVAIFGVPKSTSKKKAALMLDCKKRPTTKPDMDNIIKVIADANNGIAYRDDTQIVQIHAAKQYGEIPGVDVRIESAQDAI